MNLLSSSAVAGALSRLGNYRVKRAQYVALQGEPDGISGATILALGLRETGLRNVNGGATWNAETEEWVQAYSDKGVFQIASEYNASALSHMLAVKSGTWGPVVPNKTPMNEGFCPRFEESLQFALREIKEGLAFAEDVDIPEAKRVHFALSAYNAGQGGALSGYRKYGNSDHYTAHGDYGEWCLAHRKPINAWLRDHPNWRVV